MSEPLPLPVRVMVKGASTVIWTSWMGGPRTDLAYPRAIERGLLAAGRPAEVRTTAAGSQRTTEAFKLWPFDIIQFSPDVVVLHYGHMECIHRFLPRWIERHAHSLRRRPGPVRDRWRKYGIGPLWRTLSRIQRAVDRLLPPLFLFRARPRVDRTLEYLITRIRTVASPLVLVMEIPPPGKVWTSWFPGLGARSAAMNETLQAVVARIDNPDVRWFPTTHLVLPHAGSADNIAPDGGHYTPEGHATIGAAIADTVLEWAQTQPHLALPDAAPAVGSRTKRTAKASSKAAPPSPAKRASRRTNASR